MNVFDELLRYRKQVIARALDKLEMQTQIEAKFTWRHPQFESGISTAGPENKASREYLFDETLNDLEEFDYTTRRFSRESFRKKLDAMSVTDLADTVRGLKVDNDHWSNKSLEFSNLTWFTYVHTPERTFKDLLGIYKEWVKYNTMLSKAYENHIKLTTGKDLAGSRKVRRSETGTLPRCEVMKRDKYGIYNRTHYEDLCNGSGLISADVIYMPPIQMRPEEGLVRGLDVENERTLVNKVTSEGEPQISKRKFTERESRIKNRLIYHII